MARRIEIELTSVRDDGSFTWRVAGAKAPRGVLDAALAGAGAKVGDVLRVEADVDLDGVTVVAVLPPREPSPVAGLLEVRPPRVEGPLVTSSVLGRGVRPERGARARGGTSAEAGGAGGGREGAEHRQRSGRGERGARPREDRRTGASPPARPAAQRRGRTGPDTRAAGGPPTPEAGREVAGGELPDRRASGQRQRPPRVLPGTRHRDELLQSLPPDRRVIADQLARGGLAAVRDALRLEAEKAREEGRPAPPSEAILAIAEELVPRLKAATWLDRAETAVRHAEDLPLRELRAAVVAAAPRDEHGRDLERRLREALDARLEKLRSGWVADIERALAAGRVLQALRLSGRPPEPSTRFPATLVGPLAAAAGAAMTADSPPERWLALLEAAAASPVRRQVRPAGLPEDPSGEVARVARLAAGRVPALAALLGMRMPPPPVPLPTVGRRPHPAPGARRSGTAPGRPPAGPETAVPEPAADAEASMPESGREPSGDGGAGLAEAVLGEPGTEPLDEREATEVG
jgi:hypothetical protein